MTARNIDPVKLKAVSEEALGLYDLLNDKQIEWIKRVTAKGRFDAIAATMLAQQAKIDKLAEENEQRRNIIDDMWPMITAGQRLRINVKYMEKELATREGITPALGGKRRG